MTETVSDPYASTTDSAEGPVFTVTGQDWDTIDASAVEGDHLVINMGPQHPSTHGVLRLVLEIDGETLRDSISGIVLLHYVFVMFIELL